VRATTAVAQVNLATALLGMGRWDELDALLAGARALWESSFSQTAVYAGTLAALDRGIPVPPAPENRAPSGDGPSDRAWDLLESAAVAVAAGDLSSACADAVSAARTVHEVSGTSDDFVWMYGLAGRLAAELGDQEEMARLIGLIEDPDRLGPGTRGYYLRLRAMASQDSEPEAVEPLLREAAESFEALGSPLWCARAMADLGVWLGRQGADEAAGEALAAARSTYEELGANGLLAELDQKLAAVT